MRLFLDIGWCDRSMQQAASPGRIIAAASDADAAIDRGLLFACVEGLTERPHAEEAAKIAATALDDAYHAGIDIGSPRQALEEALDAANSALYTGSARGRAAVIAALALHGRRWFVGHAGNIRVWHFRDLQLRQLTRDHVAPRTLGRAEATRACGFAGALGAEYGEGDLKEGDVFVLTSPGVHETLDGPAMLGVLQSDCTARQQAETLAERAGAKAPGYIGVAVARVEKLPAAAPTAHDGSALPVIELPEPGVEVDGFLIKKTVLKNRRYRLYKAEDRESGKTVTLRFPDPALAQNALALLREERMARRIAGSFMLKPAPLRPERRTALYAVLEYRRTETLARRIRRKRGLPPREALRLGAQLLAALDSLHGQGVIHRDIRARSLLYDKRNRRLRMPGFGAESDDVSDGKDRRLRSNTLSYWAPELFAGSPANERTDIYAAGVAIYLMLTAKYPYGKIRARDAWQQPRLYTPAGTHREGLPGGIDDVLERACAVDPARRYASAAQFAAALDTLQVAAAPRPARAFVSAGSATDTAGTEQPWWLAAGLAAALAAYLYFTLR